MEFDTPSHEITGGKYDHESNNYQSFVDIKDDQLNHAMASMCLTENPVANYPKFESKSVIDLDRFWTIFEDIDSLENEVTKGKLASNVKAIKKKVDKYIVLFKNANADVFNKSVQAQTWVSRSVANYELELLLRFEDVVKRLQKLSKLLGESLVISHIGVSEVGNRMSTIKEVSRSLQAVVRILERKLNKFLLDYSVSAAKRADLVHQNRSVDIICQDSEEPNEEEDDWKVVLPSSSATNGGDTNSRPRKNTKSGKAKKGKGKKK